jgi:predicted small lipoprotein YifL
VTIALPLGLNMVFVTMLLLFLVVFRKLIVRVILALLVLALAAATLAPAGRRPPPELPVFVVDSARMPNIAQHDRQAIADGHPQVLTRADPLTARKNRAAACGRFREPPLSCDEYPFAVTFQGGENASIRGVPLVEQLRQGGDLSNFFRKYSIGLGDPFLVVVG